MQIFSTPVEAKKFFVAKIVEQANLEGAPLSDLETKMLTFTEVGFDAVPEMIDWSGQLDEQEDSDEYEAKISELLKHAYDRDISEAKRFSTEDTQQTWQKAYQVLSTEDHYILVMIEAALGGKLKKKLFGLF